MHCDTCTHSASKKEKVKEQKKQFTAYEKLGEQDERCREQMASCETRDVRARQVRKSSLFLPSALSHVLLLSVKGHCGTWAACL